MERSPHHGAQCLFLAIFLSVSVPSSSVPGATCTATSRNCGSLCQVPDECNCNEYYGRCTCQNKAAALLESGRCITTSVPASEKKTTCTEDRQLGAHVLLVVGTTQSPEMNSEDLARGRPSRAMNSILHWCAASAVGATSEKIHLAEIKLISNTNTTAAGLLFFDISFFLCAEDVAELVHARVFERRFIEAWQSFVAFPVTTLRLLELHEERKTDLEPSALTSSLPRPISGGNNKVEETSSDNPAFQDLIWIAPAIGVAVLLLLFTLCRLARHKYKTKRAAAPFNAPPQYWGDVAPSIHQDLPVTQTLPETVPQGLGGGALASVAYNFNPCSTEGYPLVAAAGLETSECLTAAQGDLFEAFARGEDWLYGRLSSNGLYGYLPEPCVVWLDAIGGVAVDLRDADVYAAASVAPPAGTIETAPATMASGPAVVGRPAPSERRE